jgi:hypothetical protein
MSRDIPEQRALPAVIDTQQHYHVDAGCSAPPWM